MRKGEILRLKWKDVDFTNGFIRGRREQKNSEARDIRSIAHIREMLRRAREGEEAVVSMFSQGETGTGFSCVREAFKAALKRAEISDFRFHDLRHTAASLLAAGGCDIITLQHILGHRRRSP